MRTILFVSLLCLCLVGKGQFPTITQGNIAPGDDRLGNWINKSKINELTIASFNIRNLGDRDRSFKDYLELADLVNEADIVILQEVGLGIFDGEPTTKNLYFQAIISQLKIALGNDWEICIPESPNGNGNGREINLALYKRAANGFSCNINWKGYIDLGEKRDMALFNAKISNNNSSQNITIASVHLKPDDPFRGQEMLKLADWAENNNSSYVIVGDFNWGYRKTSNIENYKGETKIMKLHDSGKTFQVFHELSYLGSAKSNQLRTNMGFRKSGYFYDQILLSPDLADDMADGGKFLEDCGIFAFDLRKGFLNSTAVDIEKERSNGLNKYLDYLKKSGESNNEDVLDKTRSYVNYYSKDQATYYISDHRIVWVQLKTF